MLTEHDFPELLLSISKENSLLPGIPPDDLADANRAEDGEPPAIVRPVLRLIVFLVISATTGVTRWIPPGPHSLPVRRSTTSPEDSLTESAEDLRPHHDNRHCDASSRKSAVIKHNPANESPYTSPDGPTPLQSVLTCRSGLLSASRRSLPTCSCSGRHLR